MLFYGGLTGMTGFLVTSRSVNFSVFDWLIRKQETFSLINSWCLVGSGQAGESGGSLGCKGWLNSLSPHLVTNCKLGKLFCHRKLYVVCWKVPECLGSNGKFHLTDILGSGTPAGTFQVFLSLCEVY